MRTILKLIVLAALAVALVQYVLPALRRHRAAARPSVVAVDSGESGAWDCVAAASAANENFTAATRAAAAQAGRDSSGYGSVVDDARAEIEDARARCTCPHVACGKAGRALDALEELVDVYGNMLSGTGMANPVSARERVENLLAEARQAAAEG